MIHKAYLDVNELGTEAAAATAIGIRATSAMIPVPPTPFRADHPFLFLIRAPAHGEFALPGVPDPALITKSSPTRGAGRH